MNGVKSITALLTFIPLATKVREMNKQLDFFLVNKTFFRAFGGSLLKKSHAKTRRPISSKSPMHVVIRSSEARGQQSFRYGKNHAKINALVTRVCRKHGIRLYEYANVGNHLHLLIRVRKFFLWKAFIRELTGSLVMLVIGNAKRAKPFFDQRPFTRVVNGWKRAYTIAKDYVVLNQMEALGLIDRTGIKIHSLDSG